MESNHENSFWKTSLKPVPGRPSPNKSDKNSKTKNNANTSTNSFELYQKSVSDAWQLSEDELTKEYFILSSEDPKLSRRSSQNAPRSHKNCQQIAVVHKPSTSSNSSLSNTVNKIESQHVEELIKKDSVENTTTDEKLQNNEYG
jgi:hypothetical protein